MGANMIGPVVYPTRKRHTGRGIWREDETPNFVSRMSLAPLEREEPIVTLKFKKIIVADIKIFLA